MTKPLKELGLEEKLALLEDCVGRLSSATGYGIDAVLAFVPALVKSGAIPKEGATEFVEAITKQNNELMEASKILREIRGDVSDDAE